MELLNPYAILIGLISVTMLFMHGSIYVCIKTEEHCTFDVENHRRGWNDGDVFGFDDANYWHGTIHRPEGKHERIILLVDITKEFVKTWAKTWPVRDKRPLETVKINPW